MRMRKLRTLRTHVLPLVAILTLTACDELADDSNNGKLLARLSGTVVGALPDEPLRLATVWKLSGGYQYGVGSCSSWEAGSQTQQIIQEVDGLAIDDSHFQVELDSAPPEDAFYPSLADGDQIDDPEHPEWSIPFDWAIGVLVAYADRNDNGRLDRCHDATCTDRVLGTSNADGNFLVLPLPQDGAASTELGIDEFFALPEGYQDTQSALLFTTEPWRPYGVREIPAGYVVQREEADVASGQRFLDGFDPDMHIEIPLSGSPLLDELSCDGGCVGSFVHGEAECPDLETGWCAVTPEMPPADAEFRGVQCREVYRDGNPVDEICSPVWSTVTWGCDRFAELWLGCPVEGPGSPPDMTWSCLQ